ncbi:MAG: TonB-dependent siderophore receptor [Moorea sp. SIO2I5]|nr:TonB-dependent siderophore receptor [Moorena sp. SIO2I5]
MVAAPARAQVVQVTDVQLISTDTGLEIVLETASGTSPQILTTSSENSLIIEVLDAQLALPSGEDFRSVAPAEGINSVTVTQFNANNIRVTVTGETGIPQAEVVPSSQGLVLSLSTTLAEAEEPSVPETTTPETQEPEEEIEVVVTQTQAGERYLVPNATTGTRTDTPLRDIPQSIQVIPRQVFQDQQVIRLDDALRNVSGVSFNGIDAGRGLIFNLRGFDRAPILRNGFREFGINPGFPEIGNLERIDVLKGPSAVLFGEVEPGGAINLITKRPLSEPFYRIETQFGNRDLIRPSIDFSGPLTTDGRLLYRLNAVYQSGDEIQDYDTDINRLFISPVFSWQISDRTDLTIELEYVNDERPASFGVPAFGNGIANIPFDQISNEPDDFIDQEFLSVGYDLEHRFSDNWKLRNGFRYINQDSLSEVILPLNFDEATGILTRNPSQQSRVIESFSLQTSVVGEFATGSIDHTLLFGVDLNRTNSDLFTRFDPFTRIPLNIFNPVYEAFPRPDFDAVLLVQDQDNETDRLGIFLQDQISLFDNLIILAGLRYDTVEQRRVGEPTRFNRNGTDETQNDDALTPRVGLVYQPIEEISLYGSYSQSFAPNTENSVDGDFFDPEEGEGFEVGVKAELLGGRLAATLAYFDITKQNVVTADPFDPFSSVATGEQSSSGVELDLVGEILPGWNIIASYAFIDAEITEDNTFEVGNRLNGIPEHSASLWTTYEIQSGDLQGLGFGLGFNFVGEREGNLENNFELDSYFLTNAAISYRPNNWRVALNFRNLFDIDYIAGATGTSRERVDTGEPFTVIGSFSVEF